MYWIDQTPVPRLIAVPLPIFAPNSRRYPSRMKWNGM
jgi:hypothetical protein